MAVDVIIIGSGPGGAWVARDLAESGLKVKVFEAGPRHNPDTDFKEDVIEINVETVATFVNHINDVLFRLDGAPAGTGLGNQS